MISNENTKEQEWQPEPPETFAIEYLNSEKTEEIKRAMRDLGFSFKSSGPGENEDEVIFIGESQNGTELVMTFKKGENYKSPAELVKENANNH